MSHDCNRLTPSHANSQFILCTR